MQLLSNNQIVGQFKQFVIAIKNSYVPTIAQESLKKNKNVLNEKQKKNIEFQTKVRAAFKVPLRIQRYFFLWNLYAFSIVLKSILMIPIDFILSFINMILVVFGSRQSQRVTFFSYLIMGILCIFTLNQSIRIFDISYLYHAFRGQSTLKLYGLMFALQVSQKLFTMIGQFLFRGVRNKLAVNYVSPNQMLPQVLSCFVYVIFHTFFIYLEFVVYIVVINNSMENFVIFCFVINLTKMKSTAFKKFDKLSYKTQINIDAKDRLQKITYLLLFRISQWEKPVQDFWIKIFFLFFVGPLIQYIKHATVQTMIGDLDIAKELTRDMFKSFYLENYQQERNNQNKEFDKYSTQRTRSVKSQAVSHIPQFLSNILNKCLDNQFTVIPYTVFLLKMIFVIIYSTEFKHQASQFLAAYLIICIFYVIIKIIMNQMRFIFSGALQQKEEPPKIQSPRHTNKNIVKTMSQMKKKRKATIPKQSASITEVSNDDTDSSQEQNFQPDLNKLDRNSFKRSKQQGDHVETRKPKNNNFDTRSQKVLGLVSPILFTKSDDQKNL